MSESGKELRRDRENDEELNRLEREREGGRERGGRERDIVGMKEEVSFIKFLFFIFVL